MIRGLVLGLVTVFSLGVYFIAIGSTVSVLDDIITSAPFNAQNAVGGSLLSWLPYLFFIVAPALILVTVAVYLLARAGRTEAFVGGRGPR